jgi:hypothetical protein
MVEDRAEQHARVIDDGLGGFATELHSRSFFPSLSRSYGHCMMKIKLNPSNMRVFIQ